jgi:hypothetical protein
MVIKIHDGIQLFPSLSRCMKTTLSQEFSNSANQHLECGQDDKKLEEKIGLLKALLESADLKRLRRNSERRLLQGKRVRFPISLQTAQT